MTINADGIADIKYKSWSMAGIIQFPKLLQELIKQKADIKVDVHNTFSGGERLLDKVIKQYFNNSIPEQLTIKKYEDSKLELIITLEERADEHLAIQGNKILAFIEPMKFDKSSKLSKEQREQIRNRFSFKENSYILVAGSVRESDEKRLMRAISGAMKILEDQGKYLEAIIIPRELDYGKKLEIDKGYSPEFKRRVRIHNTIGELADLYEIADIAYIGGTWDDEKGQNPLEAAVYGKRIISGPVFENNKEIYQTLIETGILKQAHTTSGLTRLICEPESDDINEIMLRTGVHIDKKRGASKEYAAKIIDKLNSFNT